MYLEHQDVIPAARDKVYNIVKDQLPELAKYFPSIAKIEEQQRKERSSDNHTLITNHWFADITLPALVSKFLNPDLLSWKDIAEWDNEKFLVNYRLESFVANDLFTAKGCNTFVSKSQNETELKVTCEIEIHADKIPGIPKLLMGKALPLLEKLIEKMLEPNLTSLGKGLKAYLKEGS